MFDTNLLMPFCLARRGEQEPIVSLRTDKSGCKGASNDAIIASVIDLSESAFALHLLFPMKFTNPLKLSLSGFDER